MPFTLTDEVLSQALAAAIDAAKAAGNLIDDCFERRLQVDGDSVDLGLETKSGSADLVTQYDKQCEDIVIEKLSNFKVDVDGAGARPFNLLCEESSPDAPLEDYPTWIIDPIDGTTSFVHLSFDCGVSIGLSLNKQPVLGVVYLPRMKEVFTAIQGKGAFCNGRTLRVSGCTTPNKAVFCTHCPYNRSAEALTAVTKINFELMHDHRVHALRSYGSAAMDACSVAFGRLDCYFEVNIQAWDMCAAVCILREAGGVVSDVNGKPFDLMRRGMIVAASKELHAVALALCEKYEYRKNLLGSS